LLPWWQNENIGTSPVFSRLVEIFQCLLGTYSDDSWTVPNTEELTNKIQNEIKIRISFQKMFLSVKVIFNCLGTPIVQPGSTPPA